MTTGKQYDIFLCYSTKNKEQADFIYKGLMREGVKVWYDEVSMSLGGTLTSCIEKGIQNSRYFLILLTKESIESDWVKWEVKLATAFEQQEQIKIIPYTFGLTTLEILNFSPNIANTSGLTNETDEKTNLERLVKLVKTK